MKIIRAILHGTQDAATLANFRDARCAASVETITKALTGNFRAEHLFALRQAVELYDTYRAKLADCDQEIERTLYPLQSESPHSRVSCAKAKESGDLRKTSLLSSFILRCSHWWEDQPHPDTGNWSVLRTPHRCGGRNRYDPLADGEALHIVAHFVTRRNKISGGKVLSSRTRRSSNRATTLLRLAAVSIGKTSTALGAFFRRLAARVGKAKAVTATARKLAVLFYKMLRYGAAY